ncbi:hypothetical protein FA15DRAFT_65771 [Coprinopsis marcescibilis]|uniref:KaiC-like domain-containing protein n=1 Tax=Coprinopsis marcescibilis TaxID=230819 RepID=A0A5C3KP43_COPMA|nr:hypothetical protein FA15DRAFT_65771 [Coprinopsis marcescibilis]
MSSSRSIFSLSLPKDVISSLTVAGYVTLADLSTATVDGLVRELDVSKETAEKILGFLVPTPSAPRTMPMTQSVATLAQQSKRVSTLCPGLDTILGGGLQQGQILEISGPPGSPKELIAANLIVQFAQLDYRTIVIDSQNVVNVGALRRSISGIAPEALRCLHYQSLISLPEVLLFFEQLPQLLDASNKDTLLVVTSISTPFYGPDLSPSHRTTLFQKLKQILAKVTMTQRLTVVATSQLANKMVNPDGSSGTYDTGAHGTLVPQIASHYLPSGKAWRVILAPDGPASGFIKLLSSPTQPPGNASVITEPYSLETVPCVAASE